METYTRYPQPGYEYKYWGWYGPAPTRRFLLSGALVFFIVIPALILLAIVGIAVLLALIAVPPLGLACVKAVCS